MVSHGAVPPVTLLGALSNLVTPEGYPGLHVYHTVFVLAVVIVNENFYFC